MNLTTAARELDAIRNDRTSNVDTLMDRVDAIGRWLAAQKKYTKKGHILLTEANDLQARLARRAYFQQESTK